MGDAVMIFLAGIGGVFLGMACLYLSIKIVSGILAWRGAGEEKK